MSEPNHYGSFKEQMLRFRASDEAREQFVSVRRDIAPRPRVYVPTLTLFLLIRASENRSL